MMKVTYLNGTLEKHKPATIERIVSLIRKEKIPGAIHSLRSSIPYLHPEYNSPADGDRIPAVIFSSCYKEGIWKSYSGLVLIEFNRLSSFEEACSLRNQIALYKKPYLAFVGSSGRSVKVVIRYTLPDDTLPQSKEEAARFHAYAYRRAAYHYQEQFNRKVTPKEPLLERVCRISWDPDCCFHPDAAPLIQESPNELPEKLPVVKEGDKPYDPLEGILPGWPRMERLNMLFETCLSQTLDEEGTTWQQDDPKTFLQVMGKYCYRAGIPEENAVRWLTNHTPAPDNMDLVRLTVRNLYREQKKPFGWKPSIPKYTKLILQTEEFMERRYDFRFNELTDEPEYRERHTFLFRYQPVTTEVMNEICMNGQKEGIAMLDPDVKRYIFSTRIPHYNALEDFFKNLPAWDGKDRIRELARRVPTPDDLWPDHFYVWFLSMVAHWMKRDRMYGNSLVPVLTGAQGFSKSVFFRSLLPPTLQDYYAENINLENKTGTELSMAQNLLINIDEFDRISQRYQAELKRLIQTPELKIRKPHQKSFRLVRRMSSFCATANPSDLLTDPSGNRRYICVRLSGPVDVSRPVAYEQVYAQAMECIRKGERYWLNTEEEKRLTEVNSRFLQIPLEIQYTLAYFRKPESGEAYEEYKAAELLAIVSKKSRQTFSKTSIKQYSEWLTAYGFERKHTRLGNVFQAIRISDTKDA